MSYQNPQIQSVADVLLPRAQGGDKTVMRSIELKSLFDQLKTLPPEQRGSFGQEVNALRQELEAALGGQTEKNEVLPPIDVTAPWDVNTARADRPSVMSASNGSQHPLMTELKEIVDIFYRMGFEFMNSREIDDDFHMFESLNFPTDHPARDDYDTFMTDEGFIAPAHVSIMQNRLQKKYKPQLESGKPISVLYAGRTFRNEDVDARHEHTFYQVELSYIGKNVNVGQLIAVLKTFLQTYYGKELEVKIQPFYFPFTEPSFEFALSCPFCNKKGCSICSQSGWIELLGCGMIHPNVLRHGGIDPTIYTGFAAGMGMDRLVMMKNNIEDVRLFESGKLDFLRQFS